MPLHRVPLLLRRLPFRPHLLLIPQSHLGTINLRDIVNLPVMQVIKKTITRFANFVLLCSVGTTFALPIPNLLETENYTSLPYQEERLTTTRTTSKEISTDATVKVTNPPYRHGTPLDTICEEDEPDEPDTKAQISRSQSHMLAIFASKTSTFISNGKRNEPTEDDILTPSSESYNGAGAEDISINETINLQDNHLTPTHSASVLQQSPIVSNASGNRLIVQSEENLLSPDIFQEQSSFYGVTEEEWVSHNDCHLAVEHINRTARRSRRLTGKVIVTPGHGSFITSL
ncbi:hypothetical protein M422DRAFT_776157 [Sphaerobolus stellatus SS14]|nr:hypothetical protein M422DRAFT_776157 [Sphaerobolus stellatus SS14]